MHAGTALAGVFASARRGREMLRHHARHRYTLLGSFERCNRLGITIGQVHATDPASEKRSTRKKLAAGGVRPAVKETKPPEMNANGRE